jgi:hypothetical protein
MALYSSANHVKMLPSLCGWSSPFLAIWPVDLTILKDVFLSIMIAVAAIIGAETMEGLEGGL